MRYALRLLLAASLATAITGCAVTVPVKVATKTTKAGVKVTKTTVKTAASALPSGESKEDKN
ncbi:hypothetical protein [Pelagicoccus mobilis]|uniref:Lipoprotein n=1 Tax=Pelagicoccus mobilis TaxID=415221 RepID=A0A934RSR4_9BACT|nr:hypothetical protein [Pelagicoccus mobilis]MBK1875696.1 hypothetical protein [Pelagicoccus mobilis]